MGPDGHVASLFPGLPQLDVDDRIAVGVTGSPKPPPERISLTLPALNRAREVWFLVTGTEKADAVAAAAAEHGDGVGSPTVVSFRRRGCDGQRADVWFLDEAAAALLP